jgi:hypothetical protein
LKVRFIEPEITANRTGPNRKKTGLSVSVLAFGNEKPFRPRTGPRSRSNTGPGSGPAIPGPGPGVQVQGQQKVAGPGPDRTLDSLVPAVVKETVLTVRAGDKHEYQVLNDNFDTH